MRLVYGGIEIMSVVAAKVYPDKIVVAADSIIVKGWSKRNSGFSA